MPNPAFKPGDVVFVYGEGKLPFWSGLLQRTIFKRKNPDGPSFSHVAVVLNDKLAYEASPHGFPLATYTAEVVDKVSPPTDPPPGAVTWSGSKLPIGIRPILLIDLFVGSKDQCVLRHPGQEPNAEHFDLTKKHLADLLGGSYSLNPLKQEAEQLLPMLSWDRVSEYAQKRLASIQANPDQIREVLKDSRVWEELKAHLPSSAVEGTFRDFFCSQLVLEVLRRAGLVQSTEGLENVTPGSLYDLLVEQDWLEVDATTYGDVVRGWLKQSPTEHQGRYYAALGTARYWHNHLYESSMIELLGATMNKFSEKLKSDAERLHRISSSLK